MMSMKLERTPTLIEREELIPITEPRKSGFTPRQVNRLVHQKLPKTELSHECSHLARSNREESTHGHHSLEYQLWLEAAKNDPPFPSQPDESYNANVWRNFRSAFGINLSTKGRTTSETVAASYPITIPKPSRVGKYTFGKFLRETPALIRDETLREIAINRTAVDNATMDKLKIRSNCRYPPIDRDGNIMPPEHYKKHPHFYKPIENIPTTEYLVEQMRSAPPTPYGYHENQIKYKPKRSPAWRFHLKSNNPHYKKVLAEIQRQNELARKPKSPSRAKTCTPASSHAGEHL